MQGLLGILFTSPLFFAILAFSLVVSITIHEFAHAYVAFKLGDPSAKLAGRLTLNPLAHLDPIGTVLLLVAGFGWGKPVGIDYYNLKNPKRDAALVSLAGPASNLALAAALSILFHLLRTSPLSALLYPVIATNIGLGVFNLIPLEPLDGFKIVGGILPPKLAVQWIQLAPYGIYILLILAATGGISLIVNPVQHFFLSALTL